MTVALELLGDLHREDVDWLLASGEEQRRPVGDLVTREGTRPEHLFVVLEGLLGVRVAAAGDRQLAALGPGEIIGEISYVEEIDASATVFVVEESLLLAVERRRLDERCARDQAFAARLYRSFARLAGRRLRQRLGTLGELLRDRPHSDDPLAGWWASLSRPLDALKDLLAEADRAALQDGEIPAPLVARIRAGFLAACDHLNRELGDASSLPESAKDELGARVKRELLPYLLLTETTERFYSKPRGYAGDYVTIELIYRDAPAGKGRLGPLLDRCFLDMQAVRAVRNRRHLIADELVALVGERASGPLHVTALASGPALELFDAYARLREPGRLVANLLDIDAQALARARAQRDALGLESQIHLWQAKLVYLALGRQDLALEPQDLVYSMGLIDYFSDKMVVRLLDFIHGLLRPGGRFLLGNFHPRNGSKAAMDHVLDWKIFHRSEEDLDRLCAASRFGRPCTRFRFEPEGVDLFAECEKRA
jgi:extracellular factor (EF) 3-hydroxypalmitic acid methyl ester biosynthesis protein